IVYVVAIGERRAQADVVKMGADDDVLAFEGWIGALEDSDDILAMTLLAFDYRVNGEIFFRIHLKRFFRGIRTGCIKSLLGAELLAGEDVVGHLHAGDYDGSAGTRRLVLEFLDLKERTIERRSALVEISHSVELLKIGDPHNSHSPVFGGVFFGGQIIGAILSERICGWAAAALLCGQFRR